MAGPPGLDELRADVRAQFLPRPVEHGPRIGVEVEWIPIVSGSGHPATLAGSGEGDLLAAVRAVARGGEWTEVRSDEGLIAFQRSSGGRISFEPGGQLEYSSPPYAGTGPLLCDLEDVAQRLTYGVEREGIRLLGCGIDPVNPVERAELRVPTERYRRMAQFFDRFGLGGRRMMRQTAALHVNLDFGPSPVLQWRVANALAPLLVAIFANSARYGGAPSGFRSFRAQQWRELDAAYVPKLGGVTDLGGATDTAPSGAVQRKKATSPGSDLDLAIEEYLELALRSPALLLGPEEADPLPFREWVGQVGLDAWHRHLTTLFPDVRPRGYLEIRSCDALPPRWYAAPIVFLAGILFDPEALAAAALRLPPPGRPDMEDAARTGLANPARLERALELFEIALKGAERLDRDLVDSAAIARATDFRDQFTARGLDPASACEDEVEGAAATRPWL